MDTNRTSDEILLQRAQAGSEPAMTELYERHAPLCRRRAFLVLRDPALAEDATQDAFLDLWRKSHTFDPRRAPLRAWLRILVHRRAVDIARREARRRLAAGITDGLDPASYTAEEVLIARLEQRQVRQAVEKLPTSQRQLLKLAYYGGFTQSQLATRLGLPLGTVKSRMHAALRLLATMLTASGS
jgi:RNA polymerase sigma factor (sigma-70 family)